MTTPLMEIVREMRRIAAHDREQADECRKLAERLGIHNGAYNELLRDKAQYEQSAQRFEKFANRIEAEAREGTWADLSARWNAITATPPAIEPVCTCEDERQCQGCAGGRAASDARKAHREPAIEAGDGYGTWQRVWDAAMEASPATQRDDAKWARLLGAVFSYAHTRTTQPPAPALTVDELKALEYAEKLNIEARFAAHHPFVRVCAALRRITQPGGGK